MNNTIETCKKYYAWAQVVILGQLNIVTGFQKRG